MYDAVVVGAGPAGSACALRLAREGVSVALVEQAAFPRVKACGEYLSSAAVAQVRDLGIADAVGQRASPLHGVQIHAGHACASFSFNSAAWSIARADLDTVMFRAACREGAAHVQARVETIALDCDGVRLATRTSDGAHRALTARMLVVADGARSACARQLRLTQREQRPRRFAIGGHYRGRHRSAHTVQMFVRGRSYLAVNPLDDERANVMLIVDEADLRINARTLDGFFEERVRSISGGECSFTVADREGKRIAIGPLEHRTRALTAPHTLLVGDAAHFVDPFTGQGVRLALYGAALAASAVTQALRDRRSEQRILRRYDTQLRSELQRRARLAAAAAFAVRTPALAPAASLFAPLVRAVSA